ncbi:MAG: radical SAM protein [Methanoregula sp.]|jgi:radical SAM protein with 4Fe4S-binding SPASM domain|uniref:radical SAM protein n=1 Tax=Methanoregula sp. TaxID=2052170 RepID=UPI003C1CC888
MNRITQCLHGRGTVSGVMHHRHTPQEQVPSKYLAYTGRRRPVVFWNLTDRCNLACSHCYSRSGPDRDTKNELSTTEALSLIDDFSATGVPLILFSGGEPLLRDDIWELARHAQEKGIKMALSTNGTLITAEIARKLRESGIEYAGISLDGAIPATHDRFRNTQGAFERSIAAFSRCREAGVRCGVRITLTKENCGELDALVDLAKTIGASRFCLYWLVPTGRGMDAYHRLQLGPDAVTGALRLLYRKAQETEPGVMEFLTVDAPQDCIHLLASMELDRSPDLNDARALITSLNGGCSAGDRVANIDPQGNVYPCQFARSPEFLVGNVRERPFSELWDDASNPVLARFRERPVPLKGRCGRCGHRELCGGGCRVRAYVASGDFYADDPFCYVQEEPGDRTT